jgi:tetratricopeptide (TPR) repeat protein
MRRYYKEIAACGAAALIATFVSGAVIAANSSVTANTCSIAAGGNASNNTLNCYIGLTPEQLRGLANVAAGMEPASVGDVGEVIANLCAIAAKNDTNNNKLNCNVGPAVLIDQIEDISGKFDITEQAALTLLHIVGEDSTIPDDKLANALIQVAEDYKRLKTQVAALRPDNPTAQSMIEQAKTEINDGHLAQAHELLRQATQAQLAAAQQARNLREQAQAAEDAQMLGAASATATEGEVALTERHYTEAADLFGQAARYVPTGRADERLSYLDRQAAALYREGDERGDNPALSESIEIWRAILQGRREKAPLDWAAAQNNLGTALWSLGRRESGTAHLEEAVAADRAALEEYTRDRVPLDWAAAQNSLGNALGGLASGRAGRRIWRRRWRRTARR